MTPLLLFANIPRGSGGGNPPRPTHAPTYPALDIPEDGKLAHNIAHFARALRKAGLPIGPGRMLDAIRAVEAAGFDRREDFYYTLQAVFVSRPEERASSPRSSASSGATRATLTT